MHSITCEKHPLSVGDFLLTEHLQTETFSLPTKSMCSNTLSLSPMIRGRKKELRLLASRLATAALLEQLESALTLKKTWTLRQNRAKKKPRLLLQGAPPACGSVPALGSVSFSLGRLSRPIHTLKGFPASRTETERSRLLFYGLEVKYEKIRSDSAVH